MQHQQSLPDNFLLPRSSYSDSEREREEFSYLLDVIGQRHVTNVDVQVRNLFMF